MKTLHNLPERDLAAHQSRQIGNTCTFHAITTAIRMLLDIRIDPQALSDEADRLWWRGRFLRVFPGWAVNPRMQVRVVQRLQKTLQLPITASFHRGTAAILPELLTIPDLVPIITLIWFRHQAPAIYYGNDGRNLNTSNSAGGHTMLLAAYDPAHQSGGQHATPWGFINPWRDLAASLYWMTDADFRKGWGFRLPFNGPNPLVLVRRLD